MIFFNKKYSFKKIQLIIVIILFSTNVFANTSAITDIDVDNSHFPPLKASALNQKSPKFLTNTLQLLSDNNPNTKRPVIILFYGQSITEQGWWKTVAKNIQTNFPQADIVFENKAIGAHTSERLIKTAEADVYPLQPDLVIFHVYGNHHDYESIIKGIRDFTLADIAIMTDHLEKFANISEETLPKNLSSHNMLNKMHNYLNKSSRKASWDGWKNYVFLPYISKQYKVELIDVRDSWKDYLITNKIPTSHLLIDNVHLNSQGEFVMSEIVSSYFQSKFSIKNKALEHEKLFLINRDLKTTSQKLILKCDGNRFDLILKPGAVEGLINISIDGNLPSFNNKTFGFTRTSTYPDSNWPAILRVRRGDNALIEEDWILSIKNANSDLTNFDFNLVGTKTGFDGVGNSNKRFISNSGRVILEPEDWNLAFAKSVYKKSLPPQFKVSWKSEFRGVNRLYLKSTLSKEIRISQDITKKMHTLEFSGPAVNRVRGLRCFN